MKNRTVALIQFDGSTKLLKIDLATGAREVVPRNDATEDQTAFGFFEVETIDKGLDTFALLATSAGPLLFFNDQQYYPAVDLSRIEINDHEKFSTFKMLHGECCIFEFSYEEKFGIGLHPYSNTREDIDFYYWLAQNNNNQELYQLYSREITYVK